jgi:uncharacterized protein
MTCNRIRVRGFVTGRPVAVPPRRSWPASCIGVLVLAGACRIAPNARANGPPIAIIDAHIHTAFTDSIEPVSGIVNSRDSLLASMRRAGIVGAVAHTDSAGGGWVDLSDHGIIHCGGVGAAPDLARLDAGLRDGHYRCIKVYLGYAWRYAADPVYAEVYELARTYGVPVVFHTGDTWSTRGKLKYADPLTIDEVAVDHPDVTFVIAHAGYPWYVSAAEVAYKNPNVYLEASAFMVGNPATVDAAWLDRYVVQPISWVFGYLEDPRKLMFGTDWPLIDMEGYVAAWKRAIPREDWQAVFHDNAARVFGIPDIRSPRPASR